MRKKNPSIRLLSTLYKPKYPGLKHCLLRFYSQEDIKTSPFPLILSPPHSLTHTPTPYSQMELYTDEKWKLSKKESRSFNGRSYNASNKAFPGDNGLCLKRSMTLKERRGSVTSTGRSFSGRCARLVKEQRARFYIMRRCVTMLVCWRDS